MMNSRDFEETLPKNIPNPQEILGEGRDAGKTLAIGETLFFKDKHVNSELEFKKQAIREGEITYHAHIGLSSWKETRRGFKTIYKILKERGGKLDRFGICLDRSMGYPSHLREKVGKGTGLVLRNREEWLEVGQVVPIQPHFGDHMLGSPAAFENTLLALECGCTTIGNISQYFNLAYLFWEDEKATAVETVKAIGALAALKSKGVLVHSNLDDGFGSQFRDLTSMLGWALFEKYVIEKLMGAKLTFCYGHVHSSPLRRIAFLQAINEVYGNDFIGSMIYGLTNKYLEDTDRNFAIAASYLSYDIAAQLKTPTGHAVTPIPVTEALRIPLPEEIAQIQLIANQVEQTAGDLYNLLDWDKIRQIKHHLIIGGRIFFHLLKASLKDSGADLNNPIELLMGLKKLGARKIETAVKKFGGLEDEEGLETLLVPTDSWREQKRLHKKVGEKITHMTSLDLSGKKAVVSATDVHEYGKELVKAVLSRLGASVRDASVVTNPLELVTIVEDELPHLLAISTYNGVALSYSKKLLDSLNIQLPIFMGGKLNQHLGGELAEDVTKDLEHMGIITCLDIYEFPRKLKQALSHLL